MLKKLGIQSRRKRRVIRYWSVFATLGVVTYLAYELTALWPIGYLLSGPVLYIALVLKYLVVTQLSFLPVPWGISFLTILPLSLLYYAGIGLMTHHLRDHANMVNRLSLLVFYAFLIVSHIGSFIQLSGYHQLP